MAVVTSGRESSPRSRTVPPSPLTSKVSPQSRGVSEEQGLKRDEGRAALQKEFAVLYGKTSLVAHLFLLHQARM